jgi:ATP-binding cassette subfamily D (ALD) protein 1
MNSEEIAFYCGEKIESALVDKIFARLKQKLKVVNLNKLWYIIIEQFMLKYVWSAAGLTMISVPLLLSSKNDHDKKEISASIAISERTEEFTMAKNLLNSAADAVERIMTSYKEVIELTGYTSRVYEMFRLLNTIKSNGPSREFDCVLNNRQDSLLKSLLSKGLVIESKEQNNISVDSISIITPNGDTIVSSLSFKVI